MDLIASTGQYLRFWNVQTSDPLRMIPSPCPTGITSMVTDRPDPRMLYLGTADGGIAVVHIVTGQVLFVARGYKYIGGAENFLVETSVVAPIRCCLQTWKHRKLQELSRQLPNAFVKRGVHAADSEDTVVQFYENVSYFMIEGSAHSVGEMVKERDGENPDISC